MSINFKKFEKWALSRFGEENVLVKGTEIRINSIFEKDDTGHHMWCNPSGGKKKHKFGVFHCFKTDSKGSLVKLVQLVDNCDRDDAVDILNGRTPIKELEKKIEAILKSSDQVGNLKQKEQVNLNLPKECHLISSLEKGNWWRVRAEEYLTKRKIPIEGLYICTGDRYKNRIIIPYYDEKERLIYWNGRALGESKCKYLGPPKEVGVGKEDVVYMAGKWPKEGETVYICEGEFNAISLLAAELSAVACGGKNMSKTQAIMLSRYKVVLCLDRDKAGKAGTMKMSSIISSMETAKSGSGDKLMFVVPPKGYNDWNEFLIKNNAELLHHYVTRNQKKIDYSGPSGTVCDMFGFSDIWR